MSDASVREGSGYRNRRRSRPVASTIPDLAVCFLGAMTVGAPVAAVSVALLAVTVRGHRTDERRRLSIGASTPTAAGE